MYTTQERVRPSHSQYWWYFWKIEKLVYVPDATMTRIAAPLTIGHFLSLFLSLFLHYEYMLLSRCFIVVLAVSIANGWLMKHTAVVFHTYKHWIRFEWNVFGTKSLWCCWKCISKIVCFSLSLQWNTMRCIWLQLWIWSIENISNAFGWMSVWPQTKLVIRILRH